MHDDQLTQLETDFVEAVKSGNVNQVKTILALGVDPNTKDLVSTVGIRAVTMAHWDIARLLIEAGADVNLTMKDKNSMLHIACLAGEIDFCELLVGRCAKVNAKNAALCTPLFLACSSSAPGAQSVVELLLRSSAKVDASDKNCFTSLIQAAHDGKSDLCKRLIQANANVEAKDDSGRTALDWAARQGHGMTCQTLIESGALLDTLSTYASTPMMRAAQGGHSGVIEMLHHAGASIFLSDRDQNTALHWSASRGFVQACETLLKLGAPVGALNNRGRSSLSGAAEHGSIQICTLLMDKGALPNLLDRNMNTPLHEAARCKGNAITSNHAEVCRLLIKRGADTEARNNSGHTPLHVAAIEGTESTVAALIQAGADHQSKAGKLSVLGLAGKHKRREMASNIKALIQSKQAEAAIDEVLLQCEASASLLGVNTR